MTLPNSMDYLASNGVIDFNADAYLNNPMAGGMNYGPAMLGGVQMQAQPKRDGFATTAKSKLTDVNFLKKAATVAISTLLIGVGICKGKKYFNAAKNSEAFKSISGFFNSAKTTVSNFISKFKK